MTTLDLHTQIPRKGMGASPDEVIDAYFQVSDHGTTITIVTDEGTEAEVRLHITVPELQALMSEAVIVECSGHALGEQTAKHRKVA